MEKLLLIGENRKLVNNIDKAIYYFRKISDNENDVEKYIILADWKCVLETNEQFTDSEYYLKNGTIRNRSLENHKYTPPTLYQKLWLEYKIDDKFLKSLNTLKELLKMLEF